jgi:hypothetical protein
MNMGFSSGTVKHPGYCKTALFQENSAGGTMSVPLGFPWSGGMFFIAPWTTVYIHQPILSLAVYYRMYPFYFVKFLLAERTGSPVVRNILDIF